LWNTFNEELLGNCLQNGEEEESELDERKSVEIQENTFDSNVLVFDTLKKYTNF